MAGFARQRIDEAIRPVLADLLERRGRYSTVRSYFEAVVAAESDLTDAPDQAEEIEVATARCPRCPLPATEAG